MSRDITQAQFDKKCAKYGFKPRSFLGYYQLPLGEGLYVSVSVLNAGPRRRTQLAYLLAQQKHMIERRKK